MIASKRHDRKKTAMPGKMFFVPDFFQSEGDEARRLQVEWLIGQVGFDETFFSKYLRVNEIEIRRWIQHAILLPSGKDAELVALWRTVQHLLSFMNFDFQKVKTLLRHRIIATPLGSASAPPWAGSSLIEYLEKNGPDVLPDVDRWVTAIRFGDFEESRGERPARFLENDHLSLG